MDNIPVFPEHAPVSLGLKPEFERAYGFCPPETADTAFNTIFGWSDFFGYGVSSFDGFIFVHYKVSGRMTVIFPFQASAFGEGEYGRRFGELMGRLASYCGENSCGLDITAVPERRLKDIPAGMFDIVDDRANYDYVYRKADLGALEGRPYSAKRNLVRQFEKNYSWSFERLDEKNLARCREFIEDWDISGEGSGVLGAGAYCMACKLLDNFGALELSGGLLYAGGKIAAATVGSVVRDFSYPEGKHPTVIVHHENGLTGYKGVYQMINRQFALHLPDELVYLNREEDMGLEGLRKAKMSYNPALLIKKSRLTLKQP